MSRFMTRVRNSQKVQGAVFMLAAELLILAAIAAYVLGCKTFLACAITTGVVVFAINKLTNVIFRDTFAKKLRLAVIVAAIACSAICLAFCHKHQEKPTVTAGDNIIDVVEVPEETKEEEPEQPEQPVHTNPVFNPVKYQKYVNEDGSLKDATEDTHENQEEAKIEITKPEEETHVAEYDEEASIDNIEVAPKAEEEENSDADTKEDVVESKKEDLVIENDDKVVDSSNVEVSVEDEIETSEIAEEVSDDLLDDIISATETEADDNSEEKEEIENVESQDVVEEKVITIEENNEEEVEVETVVETVVEEEEKINVQPQVEVEEEVVVVKPVTVSAVDGYTANVNSDAQFVISGDDVVIDGLDGINYTFDGSLLTVKTGSEATVLTIEVSNSVNTVEFDLTINA